MNSKCDFESSFVFVVDDEPMVRKAISQSLATLGCKVAAYSNAFECLEAIKNTPCDLIISDINMPEMSGLQLLRKITSLNLSTDVLLITGYGDIPLAVEAVKAGAIDFLEKPLTEEVLLPLVGSILQKKRAGSKLPITETEKRILCHVASGMSNKEIAHALGRSIRTIENHRHKLMRKLKADSVAELTRIALLHGLIKLDHDS